MPGLLRITYFRLSRTATSSNQLARRKSEGLRGSAYQRLKRRALCFVSCPLSVVQNYSKEDCAKQLTNYPACYQTEGQLTAPFDSLFNTSMTHRIRNYSIIAHIDHGKSTLATACSFDRCRHGRDMSEQILDDMDLERERGITIKAHAVRLDYKAQDGQSYILNLIDTPGHVDFSYEVSRSLSACEGALLVVDASQGVEAQTLANTYLAIENNLELIPVINKIDLPGAEPDKAIEQIEHFIGLETHNAIFTSAKTGVGVAEVLEAIVREVPSPKGDPSAPLKALIFDSWYDSYRGVIVLFRVIDGSIKKGMKIRFFNAGRDYQVETSLLTGRDRRQSMNSSGEDLTASIKAMLMQIGDTVTGKEADERAIPGYQEIKPMSSPGCTRLTQSV